MASSNSANPEVAVFWTACGRVSSSRINKRLVFGMSPDVYYYGVSMYQKSNNYAKKPASAPAAAAPAAAREKSYPSHTLNVKVGKDGELTKVTGLFSEQSKNGSNYLKVTLKEEVTFPAGTTLMIFENRPKE